MENVSTQDAVKHTILRMVVVACATVGAGLVFFRLNVFDMGMIASQFLTSGITAAITYAALRTPRWRDGFVALLVWYIVLTFLIVQFRAYLLILDFAYVAGIAAAVYLYYYLIRKEMVRGVLQRVAAAGVIMALANAVIILFLGMFNAHAVYASPGSYASAVFRNLQFGTLIGIGFGLGVELAEYIIRRMAPA
ncbi:MAG TPA: hypothetical protein VF514_11000 [Bacteroidota bacterium]